MRPNSRRLWIHQRLSCRKILSRRKTVYHRRRNQRNPAAGNCAADFKGLEEQEFTAETRRRGEENPGDLATNFANEHEFWSLIRSFRDLYFDFLYLLFPDSC